MMLAIATTSLGALILAVTLGILVANATSHEKPRN
jgi:hypothetical protein